MLIESEFFGTCAFDRLVFYGVFLVFNAVGFVKDEVFPHESMRC